MRLSDKQMEKEEYGEEVEPQEQKEKEDEMVEI
jgi:hypothetical protein